MLAYVKSCNKAPARKITRDRMVTGREKAHVLISLLVISGASMSSKREWLQGFPGRSTCGTDSVLAQRHPQAAAGGGVRLCRHLPGHVLRESAR